MMESSKRQRTLTWRRDDVPYCKCPTLSYTHAHCPCDNCKGKAVSRSTEFRHWEDAQLAISTSASTSTVTDDPQSPDGSDLPTPDVSEIRTATNDEPDSPTVATTEAPIPDAQDATCSQMCFNPTSSSSGVQSDVAQAVIKAMELNEEVKGSQKSFLNILQFGKELYCKGDTLLEEQWPKTWHASIQLLQRYGYSDPDEFYICLGDSHPCTYDILKTPDDVCRYCKQPGNIKYYYLKLGDKIKRWCGDPVFCAKMTAHWEEKHHWLGVQGGWSLKNEIWDGSHFSELSWFWDPNEEWIVPVYCPSCGMVVCSRIIQEAIGDVNIRELSKSVTIELECPECYSKFDHCPRVVSGDPRNIALIGHWDGWQPFSTSGKHSCGKNQ